MAKRRLAGRRCEPQTSSTRARSGSNGRGGWPAARARSCRRRGRVTWGVPRVRDLVNWQARVLVRPCGARVDDRHWWGSKARPASEADDARGGKELTTCAGVGGCAWPAGATDRDDVAGGQQLQSDLAGQGAACTAVAIRPPARVSPRSRPLPFPLSEWSLSQLLSRDSRRRDDADVLQKPAFVTNEPDPNTETTSDGDGELEGGGGRAPEEGREPRRRGERGNLRKDERRRDVRTDEKAVRDRANGGVSGAEEREKGGKEEGGGKGAERRRWRAAAVAAEAKERWQ